MSAFDAIVWMIIILAIVLKLVRSIRIVPTQSAYIVERLGRYSKTLGPGFHVLTPFLDRVAYVQVLRHVAGQDLRYALLREPDEGAGVLA